jgi:hypothetical protein
MSRTFTIETAEGLSCTCEFNQILGISQNYTFYDMQEPDNVDYWRSFFEDYAVKITQHLLQFTTQISLKVAANGRYMQHDSGLISNQSA